MTCTIDEQTRAWIRANFKVFATGSEGEFCAIQSRNGWGVYVCDGFTRVHLTHENQGRISHEGNVTIEMLRGTCDMFGIELPDREYKGGNR
jgi:hypothetical protein